MDIQKYVSYVKVFFDFYSEGKVEVKWQKNGAGLSSLINFEEELQHYDSSFSTEEFIEVVFEVIKIAKNVALGLEGSEFDSDHINIVKEIFLQDQEFVQYINLHCSSKLYLLESIECDVQSIRKKDDYKVIGNTAVVSYYLNSSDTNEDANTKRISIELTKKELEDVMKSLSEIHNVLVNLEKGN
ncbi:hypothetical protein MHH33_07015 [Paenisporosarcina sp. FSL H8-0542]|uniref:hypothetical protein n=1 Tax=Paenisporosarcina sp. FSL H8-0542 TaxID=2921401 RepID=UPI00315A0F5B